MAEWEADHETVRRVCEQAREAVHKAEQTAKKSRKDVPVKLLDELRHAYGVSCLALECAVGLYTAHEDTVRELTSRLMDTRQRLENLERRWHQLTGERP